MANIHKWHRPNDNNYGYYMRTNVAGVTATVLYGVWGRIGSAVKGYRVRVGGKSIEGIYKSVRDAEAAADKVLGK